MNERRIHRIFVASVLLKGAHAVIECVGGMMLALVSTGTIAAFVNLLTQEELVEDGNLPSKLSHTRYSYGIILHDPFAAYER